MSYEPASDKLGGFSQNDGTLDFYFRVNTILEKNMTVLDIGAGRAAWLEKENINLKKELRLLKGKVKKVIAADVDPIVLENKTADECIVLEGDQLPFEDESIDVVIADYVLEHIEEPNLFSNEVDRILKRGGYFCARTPHKYHYVSIAAAATKNSAHSGLLKRIQPHRKEIDVFPTHYKLNTMRDVLRYFPTFHDFSFIYRGDPSYFFGNKYFYKILNFTHRFMPSFLCGNLFIFLKKDGALKN